MLNGQRVDLELFKEAKLWVQHTTSQAQPGYLTNLILLSHQPQVDERRALLVTKIRRK